MAYGPPSSSSRRRNCVSGGMSGAPVPHSGVIHQSLHRAAARNRRQCNYKYTFIVSRCFAEPPLKNRKGSLMVDYTGASMMVSDT